MYSLITEWKKILLVVPSRHGEFLLFYEKPLRWREKSIMRFISRKQLSLEIFQKKRIIKCYTLA